MKNNHPVPLQFFILLILLTVCFPLHGTADDAPVSEVEQLVRKIESRSNAWIAYRAKLDLVFTNAKNETGSCRGELTYDRLNEKMLLRCVNDRKDLLFIFKTSDTRFELYLGPARTVYRGNIFQAEDPTDIESHLEPLALYRSLKLMAIPDDTAEITGKENGTETLSLWTRKENVEYVSRMITADDEGNVVTEGYYTPDGNARNLIYRSDFKKIKDSARLLPEPVYFPYRIKLITHDPLGGNEKTTRMTFEKISLLPSVEKKAWEIAYPPGTQFVDL